MYEGPLERKMEAVDVVVSPKEQTEFSVVATQFLKLRSQAKALKVKQGELHAKIMEFVEQYGYDHKGGQILELPEPVEGVSKMIRQRKTSQTMDQEEAERRLRGLGLYDRCTKEVRVLDSDEIMACLYDGLLTQEDIEAMLPIKETWALVPK